MEQAEDRIQIQIVALLRLYKARGDLDFFAIPNGGWRGWNEAKKLKRMGVRAGVPDLVVFAKGKYLWLEIKRPASNGRRAGVLSKEQREFIKNEHFGPDCCKIVCYSVDCAQKAVEGLLCGGGQEKGGAKT